MPTDSEKIDVIQYILGSLSLTDTEKRDQINIIELHSRIHYLEQENKELRELLREMNSNLSKFMQTDTSSIEESGTIDQKYDETKILRECLSDFIKNRRRAILFKCLLDAKEVVKQEMISASKYNSCTISRLMVKLKKMGIIRKPEKSVYELCVDEETKGYIEKLLESWLERPA